MFKVLNKENLELYSCKTLDEALIFSKAYSFFVTIKGDGFEVVGKFGVDAIENGLCPDGVEYDWDKSSRIGNTKR